MHPRLISSALRKFIALIAAKIRCFFVSSTNGMGGAKRACVVAVSMVMESG